MKPLMKNSLFIAFLLFFLLGAAGVSAQDFHCYKAAKKDYKSEKKHWKVHRKMFADRPRKAAKKYTKSIKKADKSYMKEYDHRYMHDHHWYWY
jgi:hypothetical protein